MDICTSTFLVSFGEGNPNVFFAKENTRPSEMEDFFEVDESVKTDWKKSVVVEKSVSVEKGCKMFLYKPCWGLRVLVMFAIGSEAKSSKRSGRKWDVVDVTPYFDCRKFH